jgi:hypothetical protein
LAGAQAKNSDSSLAQPDGRHAASERWRGSLLQPSGSSQNLE